MALRVTTYPGSLTRVWENCWLTWFARMSGVFRPLPEGAIVACSPAYDAEFYLVLGLRRQEGSSTPSTFEAPCARRQALQAQPVMMHHGRK